jgi:hypothetical protein
VKKDKRSVRGTVGKREEMGTSQGKSIGEMYREHVITLLKAEGVPEEKWWATRGETRLLRMPTSHIKASMKLTEHPGGEKAVILVRYARETEEGFFAEHEYYRLRDLPNDLVSADDLERLGIETVDGKAGGGS